MRRLELDEKIAAQIAGEKAQLEMLRYQLNPHFLFNALNSIYGLVYPHSKPAGELVRRLSEFCRGTLTRTRHQWRSLAEECAMLRTYLDIEQARCRERLVMNSPSIPRSVICAYRRFCFCRSWTTRSNTAAPPAPMCVRSALPRNAPTMAPSPSRSPTRARGWRRPIRAPRPRPASAWKISARA
ncbi:MAG: histidine kinase [Undibacterium sp.]|nr:histidine kinase [Opitutaceae bacterium]